MNIKIQHDAPLYNALEKFRRLRVVPFDVPGHKRGRGNTQLVDFLGQQCVEIDVNSMKPLDNLCHPISVIKEAEDLAADAFGAAHAFFMVGGTTSAVQSMVFTACKRSDKIIMPRNVHKSAINALVLCGAEPVYIDPKVDTKLGIPLGMELEDVRNAIKANPDAKAILINNPSYYGICSDLKSIVDLAHEHGMLALVDEAHGTHLYFGKKSYLLLGSLDISRRNLALHGEESFGKVCEMASYARAEINEIDGYYAFGSELINGGSIYDFDETKLVINTRGIGLTGIEVYDLLREEYDIQMEFGDLSNVLAYISIGDRLQDIERLAGALSDIARLYSKPEGSFFSAEYITPIVKATPQEAFYAEKIKLPIDETVGKICAESVMCYPPGIPILAPGEMITCEIIDYIKLAKEKGCSMQGPESEDISELCVLK